MREEVGNWWKQAQEDLESAEAIFDIGRYYVTAFLCQQAVEKGLKALHIQKKRENITTHNLVELARRVGFPESQMHLLKEVNPDYVITRYADAANGVPAEIFDEKITKEHLGYAREALEWISKQLKS
jgi:HEPN domain-containing protein